MDSGYIAGGPQVETFEKKFCAAVRRRYAIAVSSGTAALAMALKALELTPKNEVAMPSYTCAAVLHALDFTGSKPLIADIAAEDMNLCSEDLKKRLSSKTAAVIVPHLFGRAADMRAILRLGVPVIEDGTQALGACIGGKPVGSFGVLSIFSFYATKMMTTGEGGMIVTDSAKLADKLRDMRDYDKKNEYRFRMNFKMTDLVAAIGIEQLKKLPSFIRARRKLAEIYNTRLCGSGQSLVLPAITKDREHVYFRYVARLPGAARLIQSLNRQGIEAKGPVFKPLHRYLGLADSAYPETLRAMRESCSLPIFPALNSPSISRICAVVQSFCAG